MSYNIFFTSDFHFGHQKMCTFLDYSGNRVRPFSTCEECDELMIENYNKIVAPGDHVYILGDIGFGSKQYVEECVKRLHGSRVILSLGNHDRWTKSWYSSLFSDIRGTFNRDNFLIGHIPVHPESKAHFKMMIHGHTHSNKVLLLDGTEDPWYRNVCMDANNYTPIPYEEITREYSIKIQKGILQRPKERRKENVE